MPPKETNMGRDAEQVAQKTPPAAAKPQPFAPLALAVLGVVYGDIGTSPIYAFRECFAGKDPLPVTHANILGLLSLVFWALVLIISIKYMVFVLRADNRGEGGIFALLALLRPEHNQQRLRRRALILLGLAGAGLLYGGVMITPAISVLSAVEGLQVAAPSLHAWVLPATVVILFLLFFFQRHGTARVGAVFGPLMLLWFLVLAILGINGIIQQPTVLQAISPWFAVRFFMDNGVAGYLVLYAVFLVATGGEALYADLGHFGKRPIRLVWFGFVLPALLINYFGQGALLLENTNGTVQPFYHLAPSWALYPLIILATAATCIASQAVITGAFSLTRQAAQLGWIPRLRVQQTSPEAHGQIYVPAVNWLLMLAAISLVLIFESSANLAAAYGVAVNSTMAITTVLAYKVARERGGWSFAKAGSLVLLFLTVDLGFLGSNILTIPDGGWLPLAMGLGVFTIMTTWRRGSTLVVEAIAAGTRDLETFIGQVENENVRRIPGTAVFFTGRLEQTPPALQQLMRHAGALYERIILVTVIIEEIPKVPPEERTELKDFGHGFYRLVIHYGFMQGLNVPSDLATCGLELNMDELHYFIGHVEMLAGRKEHGMVVWRDRLFAFMARNTPDATAYYQIPTAQIMDVGLKLGI